MHKSSMKHVRKPEKKPAKLRLLLWAVLGVLLIALLAALFILFGPKQPAAAQPDSVSCSSVPEVDTEETVSSEMETSEDPKVSEESEVSEEAEEETEPETEISFPEVEAPEAGSITYEEYLALDVEVQQAYYEKFATPDDFFVWLNEAEAEYEAEQESSETKQPEDGDITIEEGGLEEWE